MSKLELKNHQVWRNLTEIVETLDTDILVKEHLELCDYQVCGYWDDHDKYYETITLPRHLTAKLTSSSIGLTHNKRFIQLKFFLLTAVDDRHSPSSEAQKVGELMLIYDENLEFVDENWLFDIDSPLLLGD